MRSRLETLELLANNLANTATSGFKADREWNGVYVSELAAAASAEEAVPASPDMPDVQGRWTDFSQGSLVSTGSPTDLALSGKGFFSVSTPGGPLYTRNGSFRVQADGKVTTKEGYALLTHKSEPLKINPASAFLVSPTGAVVQDGTLVAQLGVTDFPSPQSMAKREGAYFTATATAGLPRMAKAEVLQGQVESANLSPSDSAVRLVDVMRQFEMLQRAVSLGAEMNRRAVEDVARVGQ